MIANFETIQTNDTLVPRWKRILDVTAIVLALPVILLVGAIVALIIRLVSRGPIFFQQERIGHLGQRFMILKFRTMHVGADTAAHKGHTSKLLRSDAPMVKMDLKGDSRIIPLGTWIRAAGLDELPQLINVLRGEMSLVGPRPCLAFECEKYRDWQKERFNTMPGLTGLWQVSGKNNTSFQEMIQLDIEYSRTKTFALDLEIMIRTVPALIVQMIEMRQHRKQGTVLTAKVMPQPEIFRCRVSRRNPAFTTRNAKNFTRAIRPIVGPF